MPRILFLMLLIWGGAFPHIVAANSAVIRGGEHGTFTRITISTSSDITGFEKKRLPDGTERVILSPGLSSVDLSRLFDRLSAGRLKAIVQSGNALDISIKCNCIVFVSRHTRNLLVVDIAERTDEPRVALPVLPKKSGAFPVSMVSAPNRRDLFALDHDEVRQISKTLASQITRSAHISGFSNTGKAVSLENEKAVPISLDVHSGLGPIDRCYWSGMVWAEVENQSRSEGKHSNDQDHSDDALRANKDGYLEVALVVRLLSIGLLEEARSAFILTGPDGKERGAFDRFVQALEGTAGLKEGRLGDCNPLEDILVTTGLNRMEIPKNGLIEALSIFSDLPLGLKLLLYPRMEKLKDEWPVSGFGDLATHLADEKALSERMSDADFGEDERPDPDGLAAISVELRQTPNVGASWIAAFSSLLEHQRYFDAIDALADGPPISSEQKTAAIRDFITHMTTYSDSVTFLQIAVTVLPGLTETVSGLSAGHVATRLKEEGFSEHAKLFEEEVVIPKSIDADGAGVLEDLSEPRPEVVSTDVLEDEQLTQGVDDLVDGWTVALAQQYLDRATSVRQTLNEALAK